MYIYTFKENFTNKYKELKSFSDVLRWKEKHLNGIVLNVLTDVYWEDCNVVDSIQWPFKEIKKIHNTLHQFKKTRF